MKCPYTLQQLIELLDSTAPSADVTSSSAVADSVIRDHVAACSDCRRRLDWLTEDGELLAAARAGTESEQPHPTALRQAMEAVDSMRITETDFDTVADQQQGDLSRLLDPADDSRDLGKIGRYQAQTVLGTGGMSVVFAAWDPVLQRRVAIKVFSSSNDAQVCQRFVREARAAAKIEHRAIVSVYEVVEREGKPPALVMPLMSGGTLQHQLGRESLTPERAAEITARIADGLAEVHRHGQVHRDIKPGNILFDLEDQAKLGDFGLVRRDTDEPLTEENVLPGTPEYLAPEMLVNNVPASATSDVYQLGMTLYSMLVGVSPYHGTVANVLRQITEGPPPKPSKQGVTIPQDLETICLKAIEREPSDRYQTAEDLSADLNRFLRGEPISASRPSIVTSTYRWSKRHPVTSMLVSITLPITLIVGLTLAAYRDQTIQREHFENLAVQAEAKSGKDKVRADLAEFDRNELMGQMLGLVAAQAAPEPQRGDMKERAIDTFAGVFERMIVRSELDPEQQNKIGGSALSAARLRAQQPNEQARARQLYERAVQEFERQLSEAPSDKHWKSLAEALRGVGTSANKMNHPQAAIEQLERACAIAARQAHQDPTSADWKLELALAETENGHAHAALGFQRHARRHFDEASRSFEQILQDEAAVFEVQGFRLWIVEGVERLASGYRRQQAFDRAIHFQQRALEQSELIGQDEYSRARQADNHVVMSEILTDAGRINEAARSLELAIEVLEQVKSESKSPQQYEAKLLEWRRRAEEKRAQANL